MNSDSRNHIKKYFFNHKYKNISFFSKPCQLVYCRFFYIMMKTKLFIIPSPPTSNRQLFWVRFVASATPTETFLATRLFQLDYLCCVHFPSFISPSGSLPCEFFWIGLRSLLSRLQKFSSSFFYSFTAGWVTLHPAPQRPKLTIIWTSIWSLWKI